MSDAGRLRDEAEAIWRAGLDAVDSGRLVREVIATTRPTFGRCPAVPAGGELEICGHRILREPPDRLVVVGAGKAGAGMAAGLEAAVDAEIVRDKLTGWVNVPEDCVRPLEAIHLHAARPAGVNEPTQAGVEGSLKILELVSQLGPADVCVVLLSGGGSALLPAPVPAITLEDKQHVTRLLMKRGASINELNCVRKQLSRIKGGGLARAARAGLVITLIISDVIGDPLDVIASGPTVLDESTPAEALAILDKYAPDPGDVPPAVTTYLSQKSAETGGSACGRVGQPFPGDVHNHVIGNNQTALSAAARKAEELGYAVHSLGSANAGEARTVGRELAELCLSVRDAGQPLRPPACLLSGGEPVVHVVSKQRAGRGGRNQEVAAACLERLWDDGMDRIAIVSGGTDGEDGPTDAAGGFADADALAAARSLRLQPAEFLAVNDTYRFLERIGGLFKTGPTHTNVMDLRVAVIGEDGKETRV